MFVRDSEKSGKKYCQHVKMPFYNPEPIWLPMEANPLWTQFSAVPSPALMSLLEGGHISPRQRFISNGLLDAPRSIQHVFTNFHWRALASSFDMVRITKTLRGDMR